MDRNTCRSLFFALCALGLGGPGWALFEAPAVPALPAAAEVGLPVVLDAGHGGEDLGAVVGRRREKDIALSIAVKVKEKLESLGAAARLTRDADVFLPLDQRVAESLYGDAAVFVSLHLNKVRHKALQGIRIYAFGREQGRLPPSHHRKVAPLPAPPAEETRAGRRLAAALVLSMRAQGFRVDPPERAGFYVLKNPRVPSVLVELGYLSNPAEAARLADPAYQDRLADALAASLRSYLLSELPVPAAFASGR